MQITSWRCSWAATRTSGHGTATSVATHSAPIHPSSAPPQLRDKHIHVGTTGHYAPRGHETFLQFSQHQSQVSAWLKVGGKNPTHHAHLH